MDSSKVSTDNITKLRRLQDEEKELVAAIAKLKSIKNKLKVEELGIMAELRERSMQAAQVMSQSGVDLSAAANSSFSWTSREQPAASAAAAGAAAVSHQPQLQLDVTSSRQFSEEEEDDEDD